MKWKLLSYNRVYTYIYIYIYMCYGYMGKMENGSYYKVQGFWV